MVPLRVLRRLNELGIPHRYEESPTSTPVPITFAIGSRLHPNPKFGHSDHWLRVADPGYWRSFLRRSR
jgi:hypothetical protein